MSSYFHLKKVQIPIYRGNLVIIFSDDASKIKSHIDDFDGEDVYGHAIYTMYKNSESFVLILNFHNKSCKMKHGVITHEAVHISSFIAESRGFQPDFNNDEPVAYLAEFVTNEVYKFMKQKKLKAV